jgi:SOS-response transcriptional repressor LexA
MATKAAAGMTPCETQIWKFMIQFQAKYNGMGPSSQEIADGCGIGSSSTVYRHLTRMVAKGTVMHRNRRFLALRGKDPAGAKAS